MAFSEKEIAAKHLIQLGIFAGTIPESLVNHVLQQPEQQHISTVIATDPTIIPFPQERDNIQFLLKAFCISDDINNNNITANEVDLFLELKRSLASKIPSRTHLLVDHTARSEHALDEIERWTLAVLIKQLNLVEVAKEFYRQSVDLRNRKLGNIPAKMLLEENNRGKEIIVVPEELQVVWSKAQRLKR